MQYRIEVGPRAESFFKKTHDKTFLKRILKKIASLELNPKPKDSKALKGSPFFRVRVGDYRIVYEIMDKKLLVTVILIRHRHDVYKKLR